MIRSKKRNKTKRLLYRCGRKHINTYTHKFKIIQIQWKPSTLSTLSTLSTYVHYITLLRNIDLEMLPHLKIYAQLSKPQLLSRLITMKTIPGDIESVDMWARTQSSELEIHLLGMLTGACYLGWFKTDKLPPTCEVRSLDTENILG